MGRRGITIIQNNDSEIWKTGPGRASAGHPGNPHTITFGGAVDGFGGLMKLGSGTVNFTSPDVLSLGTFVVESGELGIGGRIGGLDVQLPGTLAPIGSLAVETDFAVAGTLAIRYGTAVHASPGRITTEGSLTLEPTSKLSISGTGSLTDAIYIIAKATAGIDGSFGTVTGIPDGYSLDTNFDDGSGAEAIALVRPLTAFDSWVASFGLSGADAGHHADPDADGLGNLLEYAFGRNPVEPDGPGPVVGRDGDFLTLTFAHIAGADLSYSIESSQDLGNTWETVHTYPSFATAGTITFKDTIAVGAVPRRFLRLRVTVGN